MNHEQTWMKENAVYTMLPPVSANGFDDISFNEIRNCDVVIVGSGPGGAVAARILSEKGYSDIEELDSPDFIFIFVPIDSALSLALSNDWSVQELANEKKIAFMTPIHLISILKMTAYMWRVDKQQKHAEEVANRAGLLLDKYSSFSEAFSNIAEKLEDAMNSYDIAHKRLTEGKGSLHTQMELLEEAGMKGKKPLSKPKSLE